MEVFHAEQVARNQALEELNELRRQRQVDLKMIQDLSRDIHQMGNKARNAFD
jgi:hypothetical protein